MNFFLPVGANSKGLDIQKNIMTGIEFINMIPDFIGNRRILS